MCTTTLFSLQALRVDPQVEIPTETVASFVSLWLREQDLRGMIEETSEKASQKV